MAELTRRLQILIDEERYARLERIARRRGASVATLVRDALDRTYGDVGQTPAEATEWFLALPEVSLDDWSEVKQDLGRALAERHRR